MNDPCFEIVDQQADFVVINKAANVNFHDEGDIGAGLFSQVKVTLQLPELYPVHRLDKMTSGLLIFAKNLAAAQTFQQLFANHDIEKYYLAIASGKPSKKQGVVKGDISKSRRGMYKLMRSQENPATTQFFSYSIGHSQRLYLLKPHSGKTHQIRVTLNSLGVPILGDPLYNIKEAADRGYLHAYALRFSLLGKRYTYRVPPTSGATYTSQVVTKQLTELKNPWQLAWPKI